MIEFVFSLWENGFVPGSATAPHRDGFNNPPDTRPARWTFFVRAGLAITRVGAGGILECGGKRSATPLSL